MKFKTILAGTALAALALVTDAGAPLGVKAIQTAEAAVNISFSVFYDGLADHGDWVQYNDAYVFIPTEVDADWRPYTRGHWVNAERYGWTWASDEPFGWATYHYGRWGYNDDIGWYWVPGKRWAPAWVSWRRSNDYVVWAPLPPTHGDDVDVSISISVGDIPEFYWVAVPVRRFLSPDLRVVIVNDDDPDYIRVINRTEYMGAPRITNNIVVNNVIDVDVITQATGEKVRTVKVIETDDPSKAKATEDQVTVFQGEVTPDKDVKPRKVRSVDEVEKVKSSQEKAGATAKPKQEPATGANTGADTESNTGAASEETPTRKRDADKAKTSAEDVTAPAEGKAETAPPAAAEDTQATEPTKKRASKKPAKSESKAPSTAEDEQPTKAEEQAAPAKKPGKVEEEKDQTGSLPAKKNTQETGKKKGKKNAAEEQQCDPASADCPAAQ